MNRGKFKRERKLKEKIQQMQWTDLKQGKAVKDSKGHKAKLCS